MRQCNWSTKLTWPAALIALSLAAAEDVRAQSGEEPSTSTSTPASVSSSAFDVAADEVSDATGDEVQGGAAEQEAASEEAAKPWYESFAVSAFADAYFFWDFNQPEPVQTDPGNPGSIHTMNQNPLHTFEVGRGFGLNQAGLNVVYPAQPAGATLSLRFGPGSERFGGFSPVGATSLEMLKQAFVTWVPVESLTLDVGRFDTIYGSEVTESYLNMNYSRGVVWFNQPATHTGLRLAYAVTPELSATLIAVNGWNYVVDNNDMKSFGAQVAYTMGGLKLMLGTIIGPELPDDNETLRVLVDFIATYGTEAISLVLNADYLHEDELNNAGAMIGARVPVSELLAAAIRGELYYSDPGEGADSSTIITATLTVDVMPSSLLLFRAEGRLDYSDAEIFPTKSGDLDKVDVSALVSAVVKTN